MKSYNKTSQQLTMRELGKREKWNAFVTLSFTKKMSVDDVSRSLKAFFIFVERSCYGRNSKMRIKRLPCIEYTAESTHVHMLMVIPDSCDKTWFMCLLSKKWKKIRFSGWANLNYGTNLELIKWFQIVETEGDRERVMDYITKKVAYDYRSVDFENTFLR